MASTRQDNGEFRLVIIGETGTGKSELANSILMDADAFKTDVSSQAVTGKCSVQQRQVLGTNISIVDTPGLFDPEIANDKMIMEITRCVWMSTPGPHAILLTIRIGRLTEQVQNTITMFQHFFGPQVTRYMIVVFTHKDCLKSRRSTKTIQEYVSNITIPVVNDVLLQCGMRYIAFDSTIEDADESVSQVKSLLEMVQSMICENGGSHYTNAMLEEADKRLKEREEQIRKEFEAAKKAEEEEIRNKYVGQLREEMLAALTDRFNEFDANFQAKKEAESNSWSTVAVEVAKAAPHVLMAINLLSAGNGSAAETGNVNQALLSLFQNMTGTNTNETSSDSGRMQTE